MDLCVHKVEEQLRRYKDKVQHHHQGDAVAAWAASRSDLLPDLRFRAPDRR